MHTVLSHFPYVSWEQMWAPGDPSWSALPDAQLTFWDYASVSVYKNLMVCRFHFWLQLRVSNASNRSLLAAMTSTAKRIRTS